MLKTIIRLLISLLCVFKQSFVKCEGGISTRTLEELFAEYEDEKNSMIAIPSNEDNYELYQDFYDELDNWMSITDSMNIIFFGPSISFMRMDAETILHVLVNVKKHLVPISKVLLAWDMITDGKTAAYLRGREYLAFGSLLNVVPEEDLYYVNFGDPSVLNYFSKYEVKLSPRKVGVLVASYKRYFGPNWYKNATFINDLGYLLCGFPPNDFQLITPDEFKKITVDTLNKIYKCSIKLIKIMYQHATSRQAYGLPHRWSSHEISRMGMLLTMVPEKDIPAIQLEAIMAISPGVMRTISQNKLEFFTKQQIFRMNQKTKRMYILRTQLRKSLTTNQLDKRSSAYKAKK